MTPRRCLACLATAASLACASGPPPDPAAAPPVADADEFVEAERALNLGDPVRVVTLLDGIEEDDPQYARARELLAEAREEAEVITVDWLETLERLIIDRNYRAARARGRYLLQRFPLSAERRELIESRLAQVDTGVESTRREIEDLRAVASDQLLRHDHEGALRTLREASALARRFDFGDALDIERVIAATELRVKRLDPEGTARARRPSKPRRRGGMANGPEPLDESGNGGSEPISAADTKKMQQLLRDAARHQKRRRYFEAIVAYERVLSDFDARNETAKTALQVLASARQALIRDYLGKANRQFVKQDLAGAAPYFRKVLALDPGNQEAKEGLQMYENLQRIRGRRDRAR